MAPEIRVRCDDATTVDCDVLILKYARRRYGLDAFVADGLRQKGRTDDEMSPEPGATCLLRSDDVVAATDIMFIGVASLNSFGYREVRELARQALSDLARRDQPTRHVALTLHGTGFGLDEHEAFESLIAGLVDSIRSGDAPGALIRISIIERDVRRAERLTALLEELLPTGRVRAAGHDDGTRVAASEERLRAAGYASSGKAHVFVAMPFAKEMSDHYHYGIQGAVRSAGFLCERADLTAFTGDILQRVQERIATATLVVADLTGANPNVYLEVGYAWGKGVPTVLLVSSTDDLRFDVRGQRCLEYESIRDLEEQLRRELEQLGDGEHAHR